MGCIRVGAVILDETSQLVSHSLGLFDRDGVVQPKKFFENEERDV